MPELTINPDLLVVSILDEYKVMPFKEVNVRSTLTDALSTTTATRRVEENAVVAPWDMGLEIARVATRGFRPEPKGRGILDHVEFLSQRNAQLVGIRCRRQPVIYIFNGDRGI